MKRLMTLLLALLTVMTVCAFPLAAEAYDSLELSPEEAEMAYETFHIAPGTPITRIYSLSLWSIEYISISDMLEHEFFPEYMTEDAVYTICDGYWTQSPVGDFGFFRLAESPEKVLGPEAKVGGYEIVFPNEQEVWVYHNGIFYTFVEAYDAELIDGHAIANICRRAGFKITEIQ